jgi:hypothetical protein
MSKEEGYKPEGYDGSFEELLDNLHKLSGEQLKAQVHVSAPAHDNDGYCGEHYSCVGLEFNEGDGLPYIVAYL